MTLQGIDVSNWKDIDVTKARDFVIVQTTWGVGNSNNTNLVNGVSTIADKQYQAALNAGKKTAYMHYYQGGDPATEADFAYQHNAGYIGTGIMMVDWEAADNPKVNNPGDFDAVLSAFEQRFGFPGIVYFSQSLYGMYKPIADRHNWGSFVAQYADMNPTGVQENPWNEDAYDCAIRQYSSMGDIGAGAYVDLDKFYGDTNAWDAYVKGSAPEQAPAVNNSLGKTHVHYALRPLNGHWLPEVTDFGDGTDGFAGLPNTQHDLLYIRADEGELRYRAHVLGVGWLDWVTQGNPNDIVHGCAGNPGQVIDGVQCYYTTPGGKPLQQAWYRSQTTNRAGWLSVCCDDGTSLFGFDGWAGMFGEPLDRFQIAVANYNPF